MSKLFWVYILANKQRSIMNIGYCTDLAQLVASHQQLTGASFYASHQTIFLVYAEPHDDEEMAALRAKKIKKWPRSWRIALIEKENPGWLDLSLNLSG
ncbi:MAG: GIY-YIG nuclease family protein [Neisseriaceae bacterium]|nr:GIY-YIG nuclease family protein [Neisseriaceae bacterium]